MREPAIAFFYKAQCKLAKIATNLPLTNYIKTKTKHVFSHKSTGSTFVDRHILIPD